MSAVFGLVAVGFWTLSEGRLDDAHRTAAEVLVKQPASAEGLRLLAAALGAKGDHGGAALAARRAAGVEPRAAERRNLLGRMLFAAGRGAEAARAFRHALALAPGERLAVGNLGVALFDLDQPDRAEPWLRRAVALAPADPEARLNLGNLLRETDRPDEAETAFRQALALRPAYAEAWSNLGGLLRERARPIAALASHRRAVRLAPGRAVLRYNRALALLGTGRYGEGWREYESRWEVIDRPRVWPGISWDGGPCEGRTLLLHAEQGFGDTLQMLRYAPLVAARGARVIVEVPPALARLAHSLPAIAAVVAQGEALPPYDAHAPLMSLPHLCGTTLATVPRATPYLAADSARIAHFAAALGPKTALRVGLVWAGSPREGLRAGRRMDRVRSLDVADLAPLAGVGGVDFVSLQMGPGAAQAGRVPFPLIDLTGEIEDFADTAALIANLDLVIGCDTSVIHLAGALGGPVWLLHRANGCWRWLPRRADSPWYPNLRLFRQERPLEWRPVIERVAEALNAKKAGPPR